MPRICHCHCRRDSHTLPWGWFFHFPSNSLPLPQFRTKSNLIRDSCPEPWTQSPAPQRLVPNTFSLREVLKTVPVLLWQSALSEQGHAGLVSGTVHRAEFSCHCQSGEPKVQKSTDSNDLSQICSPRLATERRDGPIKSLRHPSTYL